jgi:hypothetical protein
MRAHLFLRHAEEMLDEKKSTPQRQPTRIAAFLIRQALEDTCNALSRACHHHAYELAPTASELRYLLALVRQLVPPITTDLPAGVCAEPQRPKKCGATKGGCPALPQTLRF